ncbi:hypothetical protein [Planctomycetes bacterium Poly30]|uniref:hypothetical protein n=1 Tax=Saltatorellus ferox TaxID=2528018 RepID=UPI0011A3713E
MQRGIRSWLSERLLWVDGLGGLLAGVLVLLAFRWLSALHGLPERWILVVAAVNLTYGGLATYLARRRHRPVRWIGALAGANVFWMVGCLGIVFWHRGSITMYGVAHLIAEGAYVGGLGAWEWRWRSRLASPRFSAIESAD